MEKINKVIDIIGVQADLGASCRGCEMGPKAIRCAGLIETAENLGYNIHDCGDISFAPGQNKNNSDSRDSIKRLNNMSAVNEINGRLYKKVVETLEAGHFPLVLGGDHSIAAGSVMAIQKHFGRTGLIWVDAHGDFNSLESTPSGNIHGTPLSAITGNGPNEILPFMEAGTGYVSAANTVIIGARALDNEEKKRIKESGITVFSMEDIDKNGIFDTIEKAVRIASDCTEGIYLSFDLDGADTSIAPGVGTPVEGGLTYREAHFLCEYLAANSKLIGLEIVELNPILDIRNKTGEFAVDLISSLLGKTII